MSQKTNRNITADVIRGFAIITVVIGHCIQQGNGLEYYTNSMYWSNKVYQFIYSFHMPLFMLLAGWFAFYSFRKVEGDRKKQWRFLGLKSVLYITPIFFWTLFEYVRGYLLNKRLGNETTGFPQIIPMFLNTFITNLWFLWAVLVCLIIVFVMHFYFKDNIILYALGFLILFVIPDGYNLGVYKFMMPYYISAFYINMYKEKLLLTKPGERISSLYKKKAWLCVILSAVVFGVLFVFYRERAFIYLSGYKLTRATLVSQAVVDMYRMLIGFAGSLFFILLWDQIVKLTKGYKWPILTAFGRNSLGVYILQGYYILMVMVIYTNGMEPVWWHIVIETIIISGVSLVSSIVLSHIPVLKFLVGK